jgi:23S rRNA (uracil1939-C5)-methyltransferase
MTPASTSTPLRIETMLYTGDGRAANGTAQPFTLPGELVQPAPNGALQILEPSPDRIAPACPHFGICGGCQYQHAAYPAQLAMKQAILRDTLAGAGLIALPEITAHAAEPWHYRNRIRLRLGNVNGQLRAGYSRRATNGTLLNQEPQFLPISECPIAAPLLWRAAEALVSLASLDSAALDAAAQRWLTAATEVELFTNADETKLQLTLFTRGQGKASTKQANPTDPGFTKLCLALQQLIPQLTGAGIAVLPQNSDRGRRFERPKPGPQWGSPGLLYSTPGATAATETGSAQDFWITRGGFFQINRHLLPELARLATAGRSGALAWDLYAGVGLFSRALATHFQQVIAVEAAQAAAADLARALKGTPHHAVASTTLDFLNFAVLQRERPDLIVMDPPRAGVGPEVCALLARVRAPEIVYVSCDPTTLARDLAQLVGNQETDGYQLAELHLVDMFPQTFHMETVAILRR